MTQITGSLVVGPDGTKFATLFVPGGEPPIYTVPGDHPNFADIEDAIQDSLADGIAIDEGILDTLNVAQAVQAKFEALGDQFSVRGNTVYFDNEPVHNALTEHILRFLEAGVENWQPLVAFGEKLFANPNEHSREQTYDWLQARLNVDGGFTLADDGDLVGYKGVQDDGNGGYQSVNTGSAIVDGQPVSGHIPNNIGSWVEMPRGDVEHAPGVGCSRGLHVGTFDYASGWGRNGKVLEVRVNPRDIVSVPTDCGAQKLRCCRYRVVGVLDAPYSEPVLGSTEWDDYDEAIDFGEGAL